MVERKARHDDDGAEPEHDEHEWEQGALVGAAAENVDADEQPDHEQGQADPDEAGLEQSGRSGHILCLEGLHVVDLQLGDEVDIVEIGGGLLSGE